jgi:hypothetical protein
VPIVALSERAEAVLLIIRTTSKTENIRKIEILENMVIPPIVKYMTNTSIIVALSYIILHILIMKYYKT